MAVLKAHTDWGFGTWVHGEYQNAALGAATAAEIVLYDTDGDTVTLAANEQLVVRDYAVRVDTSGDVLLMFNNAITASRHIDRGPIPAYGALAGNFIRGFLGPAVSGNVGKPWVINSAACEIAAQLTGVVLVSPAQPA